MRRDYVASTLIRRHFDTKCPLGTREHLTFLADSERQFGTAFCIRWPETMQFKGCSIDGYIISEDPNDIGFARVCRRMYCRYVIQLDVVLHLYIR